MAVEWPPPWVALPAMQPYEPATQGMPEAYIQLSWLPFWQALTPAEQADYLDRWNASPAWRDAIAFLYDGHHGIDWAEENRLEAEALDALVHPRCPWWRRWQRR